MRTQTTPPSLTASRARRPASRSLSPPRIQIPPPPASPSPSPGVSNSAHLARKRVLGRRDLGLGRVGLLEGPERRPVKAPRGPGGDALADGGGAAPQRRELVGESLCLVAPEPLDSVCDSASGLCHADVRGAV